MTAVILDVGAATVVGAAIRMERRNLSAWERRLLVQRLASLAANGDAAAKLMHRRFCARRRQPTS